MENYYSENEVRWLPLSIYGGSFLRGLLKDHGYVMDEGIILVADNEAQARRFISAYCSKSRGNGVKVTNANPKDLANYQCGLLNIRKGLREEQLSKYLEKDQFTPVILVGGVIPEYLRSERYIFRLREEDVEEVCSKKFASIVEGFSTYILKNIGEVCRIIRELEDSIVMTEYDGRECEKNIFAIYAVVGRVYSRYLRQAYSEQAASDFFQSYVRETKERILQIQDFACGEELSEMLSLLIWEYMEDNPQIVVYDSEIIDSRGYEALKAGCAVLYDAGFYFFPPKLFMDICSPLLQTASEPEIKKQLREKGILFCNSADYTVKKMLVNVYGAKERIRMFWIYKNMVEFPDNLRLEDIFANDASMDRR